MLYPLSYEGASRSVGGNGGARRDRPGWNTGAVALGLFLAILIVSLFSDSTNDWLGIGLSDFLVPLLMAALLRWVRAGER